MGYLTKAKKTVYPTIYPKQDGWLVGWVLWYINLWRLFNAKSIFT